jgi:putative ABC transport system substrate-binding protein
MWRREFIVALCSLAAASTPLSARAQQRGKTYRIATVSVAVSVTEMTETGAEHYRAFLGELRRLGYVEGENLVVERFSAEGHREQYRDIVGKVVRSHPDAVLAIGSVLLEFKAQTATIPIVGYSPDPLGAGIVRSLARPGGNITGVSPDAGIDIWGKRLSFLKEAIPRLSRVGLLVTSETYGQRAAAMLKEASEKAGISLVGAPLASPFNEIAYRRAFVSMVQQSAEAIYVSDETENYANQRLIIELAQEHRLPAIYAYRVITQIGGLMSYEADLPDMFGHAADQIDQILKGTKPGDIPFYQARKFNLVINLKTAKALGIEIPTPLLAQADEVVE